MSRHTAVRHMSREGSKSRARSPFLHSSSIKKLNLNFETSVHRFYSLIRALSDYTKDDDEDQLGVSPASFSPSVAGYMYNRNKPQAPTSFADHLLEEVAFEVPSR